jgi:hypothetical protein
VREDLPVMAGYGATSGHVESGPRVLHWCLLRSQSVCKCCHWHWCQLSAAAVPGEREKNYICWCWSPFGVVMVIVVVAVGRS